MEKNIIAEYKDVQTKHSLRNTH